MNHVDHHQAYSKNKEIKGDLLTIRYRGYTGRQSGCELELHNILCNWGIEIFAPYNYCTVL